jgi:hypothetical protein
VRLDHVHHVDNDSWIKGLVESRSTQKVPGVNQEVDETEPQISSGENVAVRTRDGLVERRCGERSCLPSCRLDHGSDRIIPKLITGEHGPSLIAINALSSSAVNRFPTTTCSINSRTEISDGVGRSHESAGS